MVRHGALRVRDSIAGQGEEIEIVEVLGGVEKTAEGTQDGEMLLGHEPVETQY